MNVNITAKYPKEEILSLLDFVGKHTKADLTQVQVNVKNCTNGAVAGMAYFGIPHIAKASEDATKLVTLRLGNAGMFPSSNMGYEYKYRKYKGRVIKKRVETHPYGGKSSPLIRYENWQEGLVAIAAHEFQHIYQYQHNLKRSEVECERVALEILNTFRQTQVQA